jgi:hypothetical protein
VDLTRQNLVEAIPSSLTLTFCLDLLHRLHIRIEREAQQIDYLAEGVEGHEIRLPETQLHVY